MSIEIKIYGDDAKTALTELAAFSRGLSGLTEAAPVVQPEQVVVAAEQPVAEQTVTRKRRTKAEIEADKASASPSVFPPFNVPSSQVAPESEDVKRQDAEDERAEAEAKKSAAAPLTLMDVKQAAAPYIQKFGMEHAQDDLARVLIDATGIGVISKLPDDQDVLGKAVQAFKDAAEANPFSRKAL